MHTEPFIWSDKTITREDIIQSLRHQRILVDDALWEKVERCRGYLEQALARKEGIYYGINTGFGALCNIKVPQQDLEQLQKNLIMSHACGLGDVVPGDIQRLILLLKILSLVKGHSGVRRELIERMIMMYNAELYPIMYEQGSLGASGDLAPLAHLSLPLIGLGEVTHHGKVLSGEAAHVMMHTKPLHLAAKEGLALLNGTQFSTAYGLHGCLRSHQLIEFATACAALSIEAFNCSPAPFDALIHGIRNQQGQIRVARKLRTWLRASDIGFREKYDVQDPYAFRCTPQVLGASLDTIAHVERVLMAEVNGVTDNPNIFPKEDKILSGGNFHAQPIALVNDFLAIAMAEVASISERRVYQLIHGLRELPPFLTELPGMHSGLMIPQYTAASIVSQNKQLATPASIDSITSSAGQEDHVSMAANAGTKLRRVLDNVERVLCIEWMTAAQAIHLRKSYRLSVDLQDLVNRYHADYVTPLHEDRVLHTDIRRTQDFYRDLFPFGTLVD